MYGDLAPHQLKALKKLKNGSILVGGVGSGKSRVGLAYFMDRAPGPDGRVDQKLIIITTAKKRDSMDWEGEAARFGIGTQEPTLATMVVDSWNNLHKYENEKGAFFLFDEQRLVGSGKWSKAFLKIAKSNEWILLSATPGDTWLDYIPVFIANGYYRNRTQFKREHVIYNAYAKFPKVDRYVGVGQLVRQRNEILVQMPYERQTTRHSVNVWTEYDVELMRRVNIDRWDIYKDEPIPNVAVMFYLMRRVVNSHPSRLFALLDLLEKHPRLIVFYNFNYELEMLRQLLDGVALNAALGIPTGWQGVYAEWNGQKHEEIPNSDSWVYLVQYTAGSEGWNCITTDATCFWSLPYSYKAWEQAHGRIDRMNTSYVDLYYYVMRSKSPIDAAIWRSLKAKKTFQNADFDIGNAQFAEIRSQNLTPKESKLWTPEQAEMIDRSQNRLWTPSD